MPCTEVQTQRPRLERLFVLISAFGPVLNTLGGGWATAAARMARRPCLAGY